MNLFKLSRSRHGWSGLLLVALMLYLGSTLLGRLMPAPAVAAQTAVTQAAADSVQTTLARSASASPGDSTGTPDDSLRIAAAPLSDSLPGAGLSAGDTARAVSAELRTDGPKNWPVDILRGVFGLVVLIGIAYLFSNNRRAVPWRMVATALVLQVVFGVFVLLGDPMGQVFAPLGWPKKAFEGLAEGFVGLLSFTGEGANFVFGNLSKGPGVDGSLGFYFFSQVLPTIIFFSALMSVLYYLGIMQRVVKVVAWVMARALGTSGAESLSCSANIFVGQTEAPLVIKPYVKTMTRSELMAVMIGGMATIAGGVMAAYVQMLGFSFAEARHIPLDAAQVRFAAELLGASIMAAPAALMMAKILYPETEESMTKGVLKIDPERPGSNVIEAAAAGAADGLMLALNVAAMLIAFIALIAFLNAVLGWVGQIGDLNGYLTAHFGKPLSMQLVLGLVLQFLAMAIGVPTQDALNFGSLIGTKVVLNEFVGYLDLAALVTKGAISDKTITMASFALCGFANFSSIAIQIGGIGPLAPERRPDLAQLGLKAVLGGSLATLTTATIAGILVG